MIRTRPVEIKPTHSRFSLWIDCAAAARLASQLQGVNQLVGADTDAESDTSSAVLGHKLESLITITDSVTITEAAGDDDPPQLDMIRFDEATNLALIGVFVGEMKGSGPFFARFGLSDAERNLIEEGTLGYIMAYIPQDESTEPLPAVALLGLGNDGWEYDGYKMPVERLGPLLTAGKEALAAL